LLTTTVDIFRRMPVLGQWAALSIGKSFVASLLMSFLANYATAAFALRNGFRVPVEGVPYLNFAIGLATFLAFMCTLALFAAIMGGLYYLKVLLSLMSRLFSFIYVPDRVQRTDRLYRMIFGSRIFLIFALAVY
jgi:hypothetical protein